MEMNRRLNALEALIVDAVIDVLPSDRASLLIEQCHRIMRIHRICSGRLSILYLREDAERYLFQDFVREEYVRLADVWMDADAHGVVADVIIENGLLAAIGLDRTVRFANFQVRHVEVCDQIHSTVWPAFLNDDEVQNLIKTYGIRVDQVERPASEKSRSNFVARLRLQNRNEVGRVLDVTDGFVFDNSRFCGVKARRIYWPSGENLDLLVESQDDTYAIAVSSKSDGFYFLDEPSASLTQLSGAFESAVNQFRDIIAQLRCAP